MTRPTDEVLMAYADGALAESERAAVDAALRDDPEAQAIVEGFRRTRLLAKEAFAEPMRAAVPAALVKSILEPPRRVETPPLRAIEGAPPSAAGGRSGAAIAGRPVRRPQLALAASVALLAGLAAGVLVARWAPTGAQTALTVGRIAAGTTLARVLDRQPSGMVSSDRRWLVVATFRDRAGRSCREVELLSGGAGQRPEAAGVACRTGDGDWIIEGAARIAATAGTTGAIEPSGVSERDALDGLLNMLGASKALTADQERTLIDNGWR